MEFTATCRHSHHDLGGAIGSLGGHVLQLSSEPYGSARTEAFWLADTSSGKVLILMPRLKGAPLATPIAAGMPALAQISRLFVKSSRVCAPSSQRAYLLPNLGG